MALPMAALAVIQQAAGALKGVVDQIVRLPDAVRGFVDAFSPATGQRLDLAFKSLQSTVGYSLEPILAAAGKVVEDFADSIAAGMNDLRQPIEQVAGLFVGTIKPVLAAAGDVVSGLADGVKALLPLTEPLGAVLEGALALGRVLTSLGVETLVEIIGKLMPQTETLADVTKYVTDTFLELALATIRLADFMLAVVGLEGALERTLKRLAQDAPAGARRQPAPTGFGLVGTEELYRRRLAAVGQGGPNVQEQSRDYLKDLRELAKEILTEMKERPEQRVRAREATAEGAAAGAGLPLGAAGATLQKIVQWLKQNDRNER